jgi:hypothetical protein
MLIRKFVISLIGLSLLSFQGVGQEVKQGVDQPPSQQDAIRGGWLKSRSSLASGPRPTTRTQPKPPAPVKPQGPCGKTTAPATASTRQQNALGLGYTLFMIKETGDAVRISPDHQFRAGERIRLLVEANRDGYIYIFSQENDEAPKLLFPNTAIAGGSNCVSAHQTFWLPEDGEIEFDNRPAREKLTVVFSETPLAKLAPSAKLEGEAVEAGLFQEVARQTAVRAGGQSGAGALLTKTEGQRGVRLSVKDPAPAVILVNQDVAQSRIVANVQLTHR